MGPYPREPAFDLARAPEAAAARRLSARAAPAVAVDQRRRPVAPRARAAARGDGARVPLLSRLHQGPRAEAEAHARLQSRLHPHPEIGQELLRGGAASQRAHRQGPDRPHRAGRRRHGGRHPRRARRAGLRHRVRRARLYAPDERDRPQRRDDRRGVAGEDLFLWRHRAARLSQPVHALRTVRPGQQRAGAAGPRPGDRLHHAADRRGPRPPGRGRADRRRDREIRRPARRRLSRHRLGRRLQELVHQRQPTPVLWPLPQSEHKAFFDPAPAEDFDFIPTAQGD